MKRIIYTLPVVYTRALVVFFCVKPRIVSVFHSTREQSAVQQGHIHTCVPQRGAEHLMEGPCGGYCWQHPHHGHHPHSRQHCGKVSSVCCSTDALWHPEDQEGPKPRYLCAVQSLGKRLAPMCDFYTWLLMQCALLSSHKVPRVMGWDPHLDY